MLMIISVTAAAVDPGKIEKMKSALDHIVFAHRQICTAWFQVHWVESVAKFVLLLCLQQHRSARTANRHRMTHHMFVHHVRAPHVQIRAPHLRAPPLHDACLQA